MGLTPESREAMMTQSLSTRADRLERQPGNQRAHAYDSSVVATPANGLFVTLRVPDSPSGLPNTLVGFSADLEVDQGGAGLFSVVASVYEAGVLLGKVIDTTTSATGWTAIRSTGTFVLLTTPGIRTYELRCVAGVPADFRNRRLIVEA